MFKPGLMIIASILAFSGAPALADEAAVAYVKTVRGEASVSHGGTAQAAAPGTPVRVGDVLRTGTDGSMGVTFKDNTIMSFGPDTEVTVDEYLFSPDKDGLRFVASMARGTLNYISGTIAKLKPEAVSLNTPTGVVGVRGTHFLARVEPVR